MIDPAPPVITTAAPLLHHSQGHDLGEYSSLLQLGVGIGIGLSLFRAPVDLRVVRLTSKLESELSILDGVNTRDAKEKIATLANMRLALSDARARLEGWLKLLLGMTVIGAVANLLLLALASHSATYPLSNIEEFALLGVSVAYYLLILAALEVLARKCLGAIHRQFRQLVR